MELPRVVCIPPLGERQVIPTLGFRPAFLVEAQGGDDGGGAVIGPYPALGGARHPTALPARESASQRSEPELR
jgi:hypothetical protein